MSPFSTPVLGLAALLTSSALWQAFVDQTLPLDVAMARYLGAVVAVWVAVSALVMIVGEPAHAGHPTGPAAPDGQQPNEAAGAAKPDQGESMPANKSSSGVVDSTNDRTSS